MTEVVRDKQAMKMFLFACRVSGWARLQHLLALEKSPVIRHAPQGDIEDFNRLGNWWLDLGSDHQANIRRIAKEMAIDVVKLDMGG
jgi:hypothetical protein